MKSIKVENLNEVLKQMGIAPIETSKLETIKNLRSKRSSKGKVEVTTTKDAGVYYKNLAGRLFFLGHPSEGQGTWVSRNDIARLNGKPIPPAPCKQV
jgi:hypothetical protein